MSAKFVLFSTGVLLPLVIVVLAIGSPLAKAATAGELLEKAIYAEETAGNLDEAVKLYEQVIAEAKTAKGAAAKAQYRLGLIYEKQGKAEQATAAFQAVVENYEGETELVAEARKRLPSAAELLPVPWVDGEELQLNIKLPTGLDIGTMIYRVEAAKTEGKDVWQCTTRGLVTANGADSLSKVACDKDSFAPLSSTWKHTLLGEAEATYSDGVVRIKIAGKDEPVVLKTSAPVYDNEQGVELFRRLPLKVGYKTTINVVSSLGSGEVKLSLEVPATETIEVPAGKFECYKLVLNIGQTFWISTDEHRYVARFAAGGVTADLARIEQRKADATEELSGEGYSLTLPAGWHSYATADGSKEGKQTTHLLDPQAVVTSQAAVGPLDSLDEDERVSPKAWTDSAFEKFKKSLKGFTVRDPGAQELAVAGGKAAAVIADFEEEGKKRTLYGVAAFGESQAVNLRFTTAADKFDELRPAFDAIVGSLKLE